MVNPKYSQAAKNLANRNKNRLNTSLDPKEKERDELFYWIMSGLEWSVHNSNPPKPVHTITINEEYMCDFKVMLKHKNISIYISQYVSKEEFYVIMKEVAESIEEMGELVEHGCRFGAICFIEEGKSELTVMMTAKN